MGGTLQKVKDISRITRASTAELGGSEPALERDRLCIYLLMKVNKLSRNQVHLTV